MSNKLIRLAQRVREISIGGETRAIWPSEKAVLVALSDDARDADGGLAKLAIAEIALRTGINRRTVEVALRRLSEAGLIERDGRPGRATASTWLRLEIPVETTARPGVDSDQTRIHTGSDPNPHRIRPESDSGPSFTNRPIDHSTSAGASEREVERQRKRQKDVAAGGVLPVGSAPDPVDQVFAAWDAWRARAGMPGGPITRNVPRRVAVDRVVASIGLGRTMMIIDTVERGVRAGRFRRKDAIGQDDIFATFDTVFEVAHGKGLNLLARLLDGEFGALDPPAPAPVPAFVPGSAGARADARAETEDIRRLRARLRAESGDHLSEAWIDPLRFELADGELLAIAPSAFHADWIRQHFVSALRVAAGGAEVRVVVREKV